MRHRVLLLLSFVAFAFVSCDQGVQRDYYENGKLKSELHYVDGKLNGECVWYFSNGQKVMQANYKDDLKEGHSLRWYVNGTLEEDCWYKHGELDSIYRSYSEKGKLACEEFFVQGKRNGPVKKWYDNGQVFQDGQYVDDMMDGLWLVFYPEGQLASRTQFDMGRGKQIGYSEEGIMMLEVHFLDNVKHGKEIHYAPNGEVVEVVEYEHGERVLEKGGKD